MKRWCASIFVLVLLLCECKAGGRGGHNTTFDANLFPGATITTLNCDGSGGDNTAWAAWKTASVAANPARAVLHVTGSCNIGSAVRLVEGIQNAVVWGYGAKVNQAYFGGTGFQQNNTTNALIQTVSAGASNVTLVTAAQTSRFSVGDWVCIAGLSLQANGFPPNLQFFEFKLITAINGGAGTITLSSPLSNSYKSTWPVINAGDAGHMPDGPAMIYQMDSTWNTNYQIYGLTVTGGGSIGMVGKNQTFYDFSVSNGITLAPTTTLSSWFFYSSSAQTFVEVDKEIDFLAFERFSGLLELQSASVNSFQLENSSLVGGGAISLLGTAKNTVLNGNTIPLMRVGPTAYGHGTSISADGNTITTATGSVIDVLISNMTFSSGTFSIARAAGTWSDAIRWGVPGQKYYFGDGSGNDNSSPHTVFTITDVTDDGTTTSFATDLGGSLPTPNCGVPACTTLVAYPAATITQKFTAPADLTQFAAPP